MTSALLFSSSLLLLIIELCDGDVILLVNKFANSFN